MKKYLNETIVSDRTWLSSGDQSWYRERITILGGTNMGARVRIHVRCNAYESQSRAKAEVWHNNCWNEIHLIAGEQITSRARYTNKDVQPEAFDGDIVELRRVAFMVLNINPIDVKL